MTKPVRVDAEARGEIREAAGWYEARRDGLGVEFLGAIDDAIGRAARLGRGVPASTDRAAVTAAG